MPLIKALNKGLLLLLLLSRFSRVRLCATLETAAHQAPPSLGFSRQEHWSGLSFPPPGDLPSLILDHLCPEKCRSKCSITGLGADAHDDASL